MNLVIASIFKCISWLNGSFLFFVFLGEHMGFLKKGSQDLSNGTNFAFELATVFLPAYLQSMVIAD
jgi:hypothetical protein